MSRVTASVAVRASLAEVWEYYFDPAGWSAWVDGFARVDSDMGYPETGGTLRWSSGPAGRGTVTERVTEHEPRRLHRVEFEDPETTGRLAVTFEIDGERTVVTQELDYRLREGGVFAKVTDRLFIRSQMRGSLSRSLARLKLEVEEVAAGTQA
jgi:polyketide cyclase/dehydrase/lipid transport protein